jgi:outer membrane protein assembly factor BamB
MKRASGLRIGGAIVLVLGFGCEPGPDPAPAAAITSTAQALGAAADNESDPAEVGDPAQIEHESPAWPQWGQNARHAGFLDVVGQKLGRNLASVVYDPLVPDEIAASGGNLLVHYQVPLVHRNDVFMEYKAGTFDPETFSTQIWGETRFAWEGGALVRKWDYASDWKPPGTRNDFWEPVFHAVLANGSVYVPGAGGTIIRLNRHTGRVQARINPWDGIDPETYTVSPLTADARGNIYYNVVKKLPGGFFQNEIVDSWLVKVGPDDCARKASYSMLTPGAPQASDSCSLFFFSDDPSTPLPFPPSPEAVPQSVPCSTQRVALNAAPAVARDGTIYSLTKPHFLPNHAFLVAVNPDLTPKWIASLEERLHDGCGVPLSEGGVLPPNGAPGGCREGANLGVDPLTNAPGSGWIDDSASSSPTVAPDGTILVGTFSLYNHFQGHLLQFDPDGEFLRAYRFGWDITPAIWKHDDTYSIVIKENHYNGPTYCFDPAFCPFDRNAATPDDPEAYFITQLSPELDVEWQFQNTNKLSCSRGADGQVTCQDDGTHPQSFEWCVNAPAVDAKGVVYSNSEDGFLYAIKQGGQHHRSIFQQLNLGAAYTPASLGGDGKIYSQNAGRLFVVGR